MSDTRPPKQTETTLVNGATDLVLADVTAGTEAVEFFPPVASLAVCADFILLTTDKVATLVLAALVLVDAVVDRVSLASEAVAVAFLSALAETILANSAKDFVFADVVAGTEVVAIFAVCTDCLIWLTTGKAATFVFLDTVLD